MPQSFFAECCGFLSALSDVISVFRIVAVIESNIILLPIVRFVCCQAGFQNFMGKGLPAIFENRAKKEIASFIAIPTAPSAGQILTFCLAYVTLPVETVRVFVYGVAFARETLHPRAQTTPVMSAMRDANAGAISAEAYCSTSIRPVAMMSSPAVRSMLPISRSFSQAIIIGA